MRVVSNILRYGKDRVADRSHRASRLGALEFSLALCGAGLICG